MKTKKITLLLAAIVGAGMILAGIASAAPEMLILEIQARGKGYEAVSEDGIVYTESKHKLDKFTLYAHCNRGTGLMPLAIYNEASGVWEQNNSLEFIETENRLLVNLPTMIIIHKDSNMIPVRSSGALRVQFKEKDGSVKSAKLKSLALSYWQTEPYDATGIRQRFGAVKMKGKKIDWDEVPEDVQALFD